MNVFSEKAIAELSNFGLKPFPIIHVKEKERKQPLKPITLFLRLNEQMQKDERLVILHGNKDGTVDVTETTRYEIGTGFVKVQLDHFCQ